MGSIELAAAALIALAQTAGQGADALLPPHPAQASLQLGAIVRQAEGVEVDPGARIVRLPPQGADIEGSGAVRFEDGGRRIVLGEGVRLEVDGQLLRERRMLKPGERLEVLGPDGGRRFRILARGAQEPRVSPWSGDGLLVPNSALQPHDSLYWLQLREQGQGAQHEGRFEVDAQDRAGSFRIVVVDGEVEEVALDGQRVDEERIERFGRRVVVRGPEGAKALELQLAPLGGATWTARAAPRGYAGVMLAEPGDALAAHLGLRPDGAVLVTSVVEDGPAAKAGLREHDLIVAVAGERGIGREELSRRLREARPGDELELTVLRQGSERTLTVRLGAAPEEQRTLLLDRLYTAGHDYRELAAATQRLQTDRDALSRLFRQRSELPGDRAERVERLLEQLEALEQRLRELERRLEGRSDALR